MMQAEAIEAMQVLPGMARKMARDKSTLTPKEMQDEMIRGMGGSISGQKKKMWAINQTGFFHMGYLLEGPPTPSAFRGLY